MGAFRSFEDMEVWQRSRELANYLYGVTSSEKFQKDEFLKARLRQLPVEIMGNLVRGHDKASGRQMIVHLSAARAAAAELRSLLYICSDQGYISNEVFQKGTSMATEISKMAYGFMRYLRESIEKQKQTDGNKKDDGKNTAQSVPDRQ